MTHLYNIKNSDKTNEAHSQHCSNMRDYTIRSLSLNASHKLFSGCFHRLLHHMLVGDRVHARKNWHVDVRAHRGWLGGAAGPTSSQSQPTYTHPDCGGTMLQAASGCIWSLWRRKR